LARLALFCVEHAGLGRYSAANGLISDPRFWAELLRPRSLRACPPILDVRRSQATRFCGRACSNADHDVAGEERVAFHSNVPEQSVQSDDTFPAGLTHRLIALPRLTMNGAIAQCPQYSVWMSLGAAQWGSP
jgi:hypothetical protein